MHQISQTMLARMEASTERSDDSRVTFTLAAICVAMFAAGMLI